VIDPFAIPFIGAAGVAVCGYLLSHARAVLRCKDAWLEAVRVCALRQVEMSGLFGFVGTARSESFALHAATRFTVQPGGVLALGVRLQTVTDRIGLSKPDIPLSQGFIVTSNEDIVIGEPRVDDRLLITGDRLAVHALLDAETRVLLIRLVQRPLLHTLNMSGGTLSFLAEARHFPETLRLVLQLAERLVQVPPVEERVAALAGGDLLPAVRLTCLRALTEERPRHAATRAALRAALSDAAAEVRLAAALTLRTEGREALLGLARDPASTGEVASRAIVALGAHFPPEDAERALEAALASGRYETVGACLDSLASRGAAHLEPVRRVLEGLSDSGVALAASALGLSGAAEAEPMLLRSLAHDLPDVRAAVIRSLGRVGSATSVPILRQLEPRGDAAFRRAVREAIASIQSRLVGAGQGQLALASDGGALSLATHADGQVSLARDERDA
jgi:HEAT repeat protein